MSLTRTSPVRRLHIKTFPSEVGQKTCWSVVQHLTGQWFEKYWRCSNVCTKSTRHSCGTDCSEHNYKWQGERSDCIETTVWENDDSTLSDFIGSTWNRKGNNIGALTLLISEAFQNTTWVSGGKLREYPSDCTSVRQGVWGGPHSVWESSLSPPGQPTPHLVSQNKTLESLVSFFAVSLLEGCLEASRACLYLLEK